MIATGRGLVILAAVTLVLAVLAVAVGSPTRVATDRSLVPRFDASRVTELVFERPGEPAVHVTRTGTTWREPEASVDAGTIDGVLSALRAARWHRVASASVAGRLRATVRVVGDPTVAFSIGDDLPGAAQTWIVRDGRQALLVDSWVAHALSPDRLQLRVRRPLAHAELTAAEVHERRGVWPDPSLLDALRAALDACELVSLDGTLDRERGTQILTAQQIGTCAGDRVFVRTPDGVGCVERSAWNAASTALAAIEQRPPAEIADRRPLPFEPVSLELPGCAARPCDGARVVELAGHPRIGGDDADPERTRELVAALTTPGVLVPRPAGTPRTTLVAVGRDGTRVTLELYPNAVARQGEPVAIQTPLQDVLVRPASMLEDPTRWREDPITITSITVDGITYTRGAVLGEWTRQPAGPIDVAVIDALASSLAMVRAPAATTAPRSGHRVAVTFTPPAGSPSTHALEVGAPVADGCAGTVDKAAVTLPLQLCTAVLAARPGM